MSAPNPVTFPHTTGTYPLGWGTVEGTSHSGPANIVTLNSWGGRPRFFSLGPDTDRDFQVRFVWSGDQLSAWRTFYVDTLKSGVKWIDMEMSIGPGATLTDMTVHIVSTPAWTATMVSFTHYSVTMTLRGVETA